MSAYREAAPKPIEPMEIPKKEPRKPMKIYNKLFIAAGINTVVAFAGFNIGAIVSDHHAIVAGNGMAIGVLAAIAAVSAGVAGLAGKIG